MDTISSMSLDALQDQMEGKGDGDNPTMQKVFSLYLHFLQTSQSEAVQRHAFAALRSFINKFSRVLFQGEASMCGRLCYEVFWVSTGINHTKRKDSFSRRKTGAASSDSYQLVSCIMVSGGSLVQLVMLGVFRSCAAAIRGSTRRAARRARSCTSSCAATSSSASARASPASICR